MDRSARPTFADPLSWLLRSRASGRITIAQWPNPPLLIFLVATGAKFVLHPGGDAGTILGGLATIALVAWAVLEVLRGVNPFRRSVGAVVLVVQLIALIPR